MSDSRYIRMSFMEPCGFEKIATEAFEINPKKHKWIADLAMWTLRKIGALHPHFDQKQLVRNVAIDTEKAALQIIRQAGHQLNLGYHRKIERILMGRKEFDELVGGAAPMMWGKPHFDIQLQMQEPAKNKPMGRYESTLRVMNVPVEVIPWMEGILVL